MSRANDPSGANCADLEIWVVPAGPIAAEPERWNLEFRVHLPGSDCFVRESAEGVVLSVDSLLDCEHDVARYGDVLTEFLFGLPHLRAAFARARGSAERLRLRLSFGPGSAALQSLPWETLRDPDRRVALLLTDSRLLFSRVTSSAGTRIARARTREGLSALLVVASPPGLGKYGLSQIDVAAELERMRVALSGIRVDTLASASNSLSAGRVTLGNIAASLRRGHDIFYLVCHGRLGNGRPALFLEDDAGEVARVGGPNFVQALIDLEHLPRLVVLVSCESAGAGEPGPPAVGQALASVGAQLAAAGVPAVLAMQGRVRTRTMEQFMPVFFGELLSDGLVDRAAAVARAAVQDPSEAWRPALLMQLRSGRLWDKREPSPAGGAVVAPEVYFRPWLDPRRSHHHCWTLIGREELCVEIVAAITAGQRRIVLLEGRGGIGKSRLLLALWHRLADGGLRVFAYQDGSISQYEHLAGLPNGEAVLLFDDAHRLHADELTLICDFAARLRPELTLLFACRPPGVEPIKRACAAAGRPFDAIVHRPIPNLSEDDRIALAAQALGPEHDPSTLARAFPDAPLFITVGGSLVRAGVISLEQIRRADALRDLVLSHFPYKPLIRNPAIQDADLHAVLGVTALLSSLSSRDLPLIHRISGLESHVAAQATSLLFDLGILEDVNGMLRILPDLYGSHATLAWALPHKLSLGRVRALWERLSEEHHRYALLRNLLELLRDIASAGQRAALGGELAAIWNACLSERRGAGESDVRRIDRYLEQMASELAPEALDLAERLAREDPCAPAPELCVALLTEVLREPESLGDPLRIRGIDLLVRLAQDGRQRRSWQALQQLAQLARFADEVSDAVEQALERGSGPPEFMSLAIDLLSCAFRTRLTAACRGEHVPDPLPCHGRIGRRLVAMVLSEPPPYLSEALRAFAATFVIAWDRWARIHATNYVDCKQSTVVLLDTLESGLSADPDIGRRYAARRALRTTAGAVDPDLTERVFAVIRRECDQFGPVIDALDPSFVPLDIFANRARDRPQARYCGEIEGIRGRAMQRLLRCAPDIEGLVELGQVGNLLLQLMVEDSLLENPARLIGAAAVWVEATIDRGFGGEAFTQALAHRHPDLPAASGGRLAFLYDISRLDEVYALIVARHSEAMQAIVMAHVLMLRDLEPLFERACEAVRLLLAETDDPMELWRRLQRTTASVPVGEDPRPYTLLYALVRERPGFAAPLARYIVESGLADGDTIAPVLQALRRHDPAAARALAQSLIDEGVGAAAVALVVVRWIGGPDDERELLRALWRVGDPGVSAHAFTAAGALAAARPEHGAEFLVAPYAPNNAEQLGAWMQGFLTGHFVLAYPPSHCAHITELLAPVAREFAAKMIHPNGALELEGVAQHVGARLTRFIAGAGALAWESMPRKLIDLLVRAVVERGALERSECQAYLVECVKQCSLSTLACFLDALTEQVQPLRLPDRLPEAMIRPLAEAGQVDGVVEILLDRARRERDANPAARVVSSFAAAALDRIEPSLIARIERDREDEELLLDVAHLLRTLDFRRLINHRRLMLLLNERPSQRTPRYQRRLAQILNDIDRKRIEIELHGRPLRQVETFIGMVTSIRTQICEPSPVATLYRDLHEILDRQFTRGRREVEV